MMKMTAHQAFRLSATADVHLIINDELWRILGGMRHSAGVAMTLEGPGGVGIGRVDYPAGADVQVEVTG